MKKFCLLLILINSIILSNAQSVGINTDGTTPHSTAMLDIKSTTKGLLIPRMTIVQRNAIVAPANGLLIYQTDESPGFYYFNGIAWVTVGITASANSTWNTFGNSGIDSVFNFIGTNDYQPLIGKVNGRQVFKFSNYVQSTAVGFNAGKVNKAHGNTFIGYEAGSSDTTAQNNTFVGFYTGKQTTTGEDNTFTGAFTGWYNSSGSKNFFGGYKAGLSNTTGNDNLFIGYAAGYSNTTQKANFFIGNYAGVYNTGTENHFVGNNAGYKNTTGSNNYFAGYNAGASNTTGFYNHFAGDEAGANNTTGSQNTFIGYMAGHEVTTASGNHFVGNLAGRYTTTGANNYFSGFKAGYDNKTGSGNYYSGIGAGMYTVSDSNLAVGNYAGYNHTGDKGTFIGLDAGKINSGSANQFIGYKAGVMNGTGYSNQFDGYKAGFNNSTGYQNLFIGLGAGYNNTTGSYNQFVGYRAGYNNTGGSNHFDGWNSGYSNTTGGNNYFSGLQSGYNNTTGIANQFVGNAAGYSNTTGVTNTYIGIKSGYLSNGSGNVFLGYNAGYNETGSNKLYIDNSSSSTPLIYGEFDNNFARVNGTAEIVRPINSGTASLFTLKEYGSKTVDVSYRNTTNANWWSTTTYPGDVSVSPYFIFNYHISGIGNAQVFRIYGNGNATMTGTLTQFSDRRFKKNIVPITNVLSKLNQLNAYTYNWTDPLQSQTQQIGFIAQEIEKEFPQLVNEDENGYKSVSYTNMVPVLLQAIKEQQKQIDQLKKLILEKK